MFAPDDALPKIFDPEEPEEFPKIFELCAEVDVTTPNGFLFGSLIGLPPRPNPPKAPTSPLFDIEPFKDSEVLLPKILF